MINNHLKDGDLTELEIEENEICNKSQEVFLPNIRPSTKVDYIFIGTEPSLGRWAKNSEDAKGKINNGFKNFIFSIEDFVLKYAIETYLSKYYYLTDISKFAKKTDETGKTASWDIWLNVLRKEIEIFGHEKTRIISMGLSQVGYLVNNGIAVNNSIYHYSTQNAWKIQRDVINKNLEEYQKFSKEAPSLDVIINFAKKYLDDNLISQEIQDELILGNLNKTKTFTDSKLSLLFYLKEEFIKINKK